MEAEIRISRKEMVLRLVLLIIWSVMIYMISVAIEQKEVCMYKTYVSGVKGTMWVCVLSEVSYKEDGGGDFRD